jgi:hypothetical protein
VLSFTKRRGLPSAILTGLVAGCLATTAAAQATNDAVPIPSSPADSLTAIERSFSAPTPPTRTLFPNVRKETEDMLPVFRDSKFNVNLRSYYRDNITNPQGGASTINEAWAGGGSAAFETGRLFDRLYGGAVFYGSFPIYAPQDRDGTGLLLPGQLGYAVVGQLYGRLRVYEENYFTAGRYLYDTPFLGPHDNRMSPNTFGGYVMQGAFGNAETGPYFRYGGGYIDEFKERNANTFQSMSRAAGAPVDYGVGVGGGLFKYGPFSLGAIEYYNQDTINIAYAEGKYGLRLSPDVSAIAALQFADQRSTGLNLLNGGTPFQTNQFGAKVEVGYQTGIVTLGYSVVNPNFAMQAPWSANPFYTDAQIQAFTRPGENALMAGLSYVFTPIGLKGVAASVFYYNAWTNSPVAGMPLTEDELDFNLEYRPDWEFLSGLWFRARYGKSNTRQNNMLTTVDEVRLIVNYSLKLY